MTNWLGIKIVALVMAAGVPAGSFYWYYFEDTLMLTEIVKQPDTPKMSIILNLVDFDTGLTRYDLHNLAEKAPYWENRMREVNSIRDPQRRAYEEDRLMAEMMQDPSFKKIAKKLLGFGLNSALAILQAVTGS